MMSSALASSAKDANATSLARQPGLLCGIDQGLGLSKGNHGKHQGISGDEWDEHMLDGVKQGANYEAHEGFAVRIMTG